MSAPGPLDDRVSAPAPRPIALLEGVLPYRVPRHPAPIDLRLDGNEGPRPSSALLEALRDEGTASIGLYPDIGRFERAVRERLGLLDRPDVATLVTAGADEAIDRMCRAFLGPGRRIVLPVPTFEMIERYARLAGGEVEPVLVDNDRFDPDEVLARVDARTHLIALVTPNNPTGRVIPLETIRTVAKRAPSVLVLVDLAYVEFADDDPTSALLELPNVLIVRTMSKAWGLAGLRVGYALGRPEIIAALSAAGGPYSVAGPSIVLASRWLELGAGFVEGAVTRVRHERVRIAERIRSLGGTAEPGQANFVRARVRDPLLVRDGMASLGIGVRVFGERPGLSDTVRITCPASEAAVLRVEHALSVVLRPDRFYLDESVAGLLGVADGADAGERSIAWFDRPVHLRRLGQDELSKVDELGRERAWIATRSIERIEAARRFGVASVAVIDASSHARDYLAAGAARAVSPNELKLLLSERGQ